MLRIINSKVKQIKAFILNAGQDAFTPIFWKEFLESLEPNGRRNYIIYDHDLPSFRDLKAILNALTAIERATDHSSLIALSVFKRLELPRDLLDLKRNFDIYMATNSKAT